MIEWIGTNSELVNIVINAVLTLVWIVYLNLFLHGIVRTRRPMIMISRGAGSGPEARLFISNMGAEPIYVTALIADVRCGGQERSVTITQNDEIQADDLDTPSARTNEGPLGAGSYMDAGSFGALMDRIALHADAKVDPASIERVTLTVVAATGHSAAISAGVKTYRVLRKEGATMFHPEHLSTQQLRNRLSRRRLLKRLNRDLQAELRA